MECRSRSRIRGPPPEVVYTPLDPSPLLFFKNE
jgi:hypothetical protein